MGKDRKGKELGIGISQRADLLYVARFTDAYGKRKQKVFPTLQESRRWLADAQFEGGQGECAFDRNITVEEWFEVWFGIKEKTIRYNTAIGYSQAYRRNIEPIIGRMRLVDINTLVCQRVLYKMADDGYKSSSITRTRYVLYSMMEYAVLNNVIIKNPCNKVVKANIGRRNTQKEALTIEQQRRFLEGIRYHPYENQYRFLLQTGLRTGEMTGLKWSDVDFNQHELHINRTLVYHYDINEWVAGQSKSQSGIRTVPLTDEAIDILKSQQLKNIIRVEAAEKWSNNVFVSKNGLPIFNSAYNDALSRICNRNELPRFSMHVLRHTFATRCIEAGMKPKTLQTILGHSDIYITMNRYVHITEDEMHREMLDIAASLKVV